MFIDFVAARMQMLSINTAESILGLIYDPLQAWLRLTLYMSDSLSSHMGWIY